METLRKIAQAAYNKLPELEQLRIESILADFEPVPELGTKLSKLLSLLTYYGAFTNREESQLIRDMHKRNPNLHYYELQSATCGREVARYLANKFPKIRLVEHKSAESKPDLILKGIRIGSCCSRAFSKPTAAKETLASRARRYNESPTFSYAFQHMRVKTIDVYLWTIVWLDKMHYYVINSDEVAMNEYAVNQNDEYDKHIKITRRNIAEFAQYRTTEKNLVNAIIDSYNKLSRKNRIITMPKTKSRPRFIFRPLPKSNIAANIINFHENKI